MRSAIPAVLLLLVNGLPLVGQTLGSAGQPIAPSGQMPEASTPIQGEVGQTPGTAVDPVPTVEIFDAAYAPLWSGTLPARARVFHLTGPGIGYRTSYSTFEGFLPWRVGSDGGAMFLDVRAIVNNAAVMGSNLGGGWRYYSETFDRTVGVNLFYDFRDSGRAGFHQIAGGLEFLGDTWDLRTNWYVPVGTTRAKVFDGITGTRNEVVESYANPRFSGNNILLDRVTKDTFIQDRLRQYDVAAAGFDAEIGGPLPPVGEWMRAYLGAYHYQGSGTPQTWGVRLRAEARLSDTLVAQIMVQNDRLFDTTVVGGFGVSFPPPRGASGRGWGISTDRLVERVERNSTIAIADQNVREDIRTDSFRQEVAVALDPVTLQPIVVRHLFGNGTPTPGGELVKAAAQQPFLIGAVERPFRTLAELQNLSKPDEILFVHAGSVFLGESIVLKDGQRLLGEGIDHLFVAAQGIFTLPRATAAANVPILRGTRQREGSDNVVTLANRTEVSGFTIDQAGGFAVFGDNVTAYGIDRNTITNPGQGGIGLVNSNGGGAIAANVIDGAPAQAILISGPLFGGAISDNTITNSGVGIAALATQLSADINGNKLTGNGTGIQLFGNKYFGNIYDNFFENNAGIGLDIRTVDFSSNVVNNTFLHNGNLGLRLIGTGGGAVLAKFMQNKLFGNNAGGAEFLVDYQGSGSICLMFSQNQSLNTPPPGSFNYDIGLTGTGSSILEFRASNFGAVGNTFGTAFTTGICPE